VEPKEIIESGVLESYVLGTASEAEVQMLHAAFATYPELLEEVEAVESALMRMAESHAPELPAQLRADLLNDLDFRNADKDKVIPLNAPREQAGQTVTKRYKYAIAASVALLIGSVAVNVMLYGKLDDAEQQVAELNQQKSIMANDMQINKASLRETQNNLAMVTDTMVKSLKLKAIPNMPASMAMVYWNSKSKEVYLNVMQLPAPPKGMQYQLWALADGKPVDAGVFEVVDTLRLQKLKDIESAQAFAVTLEKEGGSPTPTLTEMYMMGAF